MARTKEDEWHYLLDIHASPPMVVLVSQDVDNVEAVGHRYANQVGRPILRVTGPATAAAQYTPAILAIEPAPLPAVEGAHAPVVTYDPDKLTDDQRAYLASLGVKTPDKKTK